MSSVNLFSGAGGWEEGAKPLGLHPIGLEWERWPCETAHAAGHHTIRADVATYPTEAFARADGLIGSPPCQAFSTAGKGVGARAMHFLGPAVHAVAAGAEPATIGLDLGDDRASLVLEPIRWARDLRPRWIALEQVPPVLPLWREMARVLNGWGYATWVGLLCAADYGVPQTRTRAILIASQDHQPTKPPPSHCQGGSDGTMFDGPLLPWVTMADALGWNGTVDYQRGAGFAERGGLRAPISTNRPAPTVNRNIHCFLLHLHGVNGPPRRLQPWEGGVLQSFPANYPWQGPKRARALQGGNAVPPLLARSVLAEAALGAPMLLGATRGHR